MPIHQIAERLGVTRARPLDQFVVRSLARLDLAVGAGQGSDT